MVNILGANSVSGGYEIENSLRYNKPDNPQLTLANVGTVTNDKKFTYSVWVKRGSLSTDPNFYILGAKSGNNRGAFYFRGGSSHAIKFIETPDVYNTFDTNLITDALFRDPSAWYHIVVAYDSTDSTAGNRVKIYANGVLQTLTGTTANENYTTVFNEANYSLYISHDNGDTGSVYDGYISEANFIDGQTLAPTDFGEVDDNGVWIPKKYTGTYGNNGFFLEFKQTGTGTNSSGIGADTSGNDRHFAPTNLAALDVMPDTPTNNWCTYNPLDLGQSSSGATFSQGNLSVSTTTAFEDHVGSTFSLDSGKWYWETKIQSGRQRESIGALLVGTGLTGFSARVQYYSRYGTITVLGSSNNTGATYGDNDIISVTLDLDNNVVKFFKNNGLQGTVNSLPEGTWVPAYFDGSNGVGALAVSTNFGQDGTFSGLETAGDNADANGFGNFKYAVPSGFFSICTKNLAEFG